MEINRTVLVNRKHFFKKKFCVATLSSFFIILSQCSLKPEAEMGWGGQQIKGFHYENWIFFINGIEIM